MTAQAAIAVLRRNANKEYARTAAWFFKTKPGQYGAGDVFIGIRVPLVRRLALQYAAMPRVEITKLLKHQIHEVRFAGLEILVYQFEHVDEPERRKIFDFYLRHTRWINNWDLVDTSAPYIVGAYLVGKSPAILYVLAKSKNLWERRIAIVATYALIKSGRYDSTMRIAEILLNDQHDLIHKATGWMLREVGKKNSAVLYAFLDKFSTKMPRTMLRYALERVPKSVRTVYLKKN